MEGSSPSQNIPSVLISNESAHAGMFGLQVRTTVSETVLAWSPALFLTSSGIYSITWFGRASQPANFTVRVRDWNQFKGHGTGILSEVCGLIFFPCIQILIQVNCSQFMFLV